MCAVYVTYVANADKGQWHGVTLVWSFKEGNVFVFWWLLKFRSWHSSQNGSTAFLNKHKTWLQIAASPFCVLNDLKRTQNFTAGAIYEQLCTVERQLRISSSSWQMVVIHCVCMLTAGRKLITLFSTFAERSHDSYISWEICLLSSQNHFTVPGGM